MDIDIKNRHKKASTLRLSTKAVEDFQSIYFQENKIRLSYEEAHSLAINLLKLFSSIYKPVRKEAYGKE